MRRPAATLLAALTLIYLLPVAADLRAAEAREADPPAHRVGLAAVDITPDYPVRLSGFGFRRAESDGVTQRIYAKAIAIAGQGEPGNPAVILCVDNLGIPAYMTRDVARRLQEKAKLDPARLAVTATHTHTAPVLNGVCNTIFGTPIPPEHQARIDRYTRELPDKLVEAALAALADLRPARLEFAIGTHDLAANRRTKGGPVDHDLPVLAIRDEDGALRGVYLSYACHCVTLSHNKLSGDWAGFVEEALRQKHPGVIALVSAGCGADSNPTSGVTGDKVDVAKAQGADLAAAVGRALSKGGRPITAPVAAKTGQIELMFDTHPTRQEWEERAKREDATGHHARVQLARLDRGEPLQTKLDYPVQTWTFGDQLAMVFLPGEVVVDYSLRLKRELDRARLWVNAYSNDVPCYIPSERILREGGYEGGGAMIYYDRPTRLAAGLEQKIIDEVRRQVPAGFVADRTEGVTPLPPEDSRRAIRTKPGLEVRLVAAEPVLASPIAVEWDAAGRLWVCEMFDYPSGTDGAWQPGGRVKLLHDADGDGRFERATTFLDGIPFPTGLTAWGRGILICAAPDILYAEDADGDGKADVVRKLFSGFATDNFQARVNSLTLGLDNWIYGANGSLGGVIASAADPAGRVDLRGRDFRFRPIAGPLEAVAGITQHGRSRDDFGRWFGCDNTNALFYYPHEERYLRRNPHVPAAAPSVRPRSLADPRQVFPASRTLERYNDPDNANRITSACSVIVYTDTLLGEAYHGNALVCEPVHNLVHRMVLSGTGAALTRDRAPDERASEFLASEDNWFRPVQVRTGPDGALYVVDMYRFLIEHPRWVPAERLAKIDVRAGADRGRIYRVVPAGATLRPVRDLTKLSGADLAAALDSPNGTERDRVHVELLVRRDAAAIPVLQRLATAAALPQVRVQALCALDGLGGLTVDLNEAALRDADARVRAHAVRLCEASIRDAASPDAARLGRAIAALAGDRDATVRQQLALTLGEWPDPAAGEALAKLAAAHLADAEVRAAVLSSSLRHSGRVLAAVLAQPADARGRAQWIAPLVATAAAASADDPALLAQALAAVTPVAADAAPSADHYAALADLLDALDRRDASLAALAEAHPILREPAARVPHALASARRDAADRTRPAALRHAALRLLGRPGAPADEIDLLCAFVTGAADDDALRDAALAALRRQASPRVAERLLAAWQRTSPSVRAIVVPLLVARDEWASALLDAIAAGGVRPNELPLADRQRLTDSPSQAIRKRAAELLPAQAAGVTRADVVAAYGSVESLVGRADEGRKVFVEQCATCHALGGVGHAVGQDLATVRNRDTAYLVLNILDPNAAVDPRFLAYEVKLRDRRVIVGLITAETGASLTLLSGGGTVETIARSDVRSIRASKLSMMPEGLEASINPQQMADLIAFIRSGAPPRKQVPGNAPQLVRAGADGSLLLPAAAAEIYGDRITFEPEFRNVGFWHGEADHVAWTVEVDRAGEFDVHLDYACAASAAGDRFILTAGSAPDVTGAVAPTGPDWGRYAQVRVGRVRLERGQHRVTVRPASAPRFALMDLRTVALTRAGAAPRWPAGVVAAAPLPAVQGADGDEVTRNPAAVARVILDPRRASAVREAAVNANPQFAADLVVELTRGLVPGTPAEYERIPWIWRVAVAAGRRNDAGQLRRMLAASLPREGEPLHHWQAVVIGGGVINGISQRGPWPGARIVEILGDDRDLLARWQRALDLASPMADDAKVPTGTRYDALRMLGVEPWAKRGAQLVKYLAKDAHAELQAGAVSGLADLPAAEAAAALIKALPDLTEANRNLALDALLRDEPRAAALLDAIAAGTLPPATLGPDRLTRLRDHPSPTLRRRAAEVLKEP